MTKMFGFLPDPILETRYSAQQEAERSRTYSYNGFTIYGAGDLFVIDSINLVDDYFTGNVTEFLVNKGATFHIINDNEAVLSGKTEDGDVWHLNYRKV